MRSPRATFSCSRRAAIGQEPKAQSLVLPPPPPDAEAPLLCLTTAFTGPQLRVLLLMSLFYHISVHTENIVLCAKEAPNKTARPPLVDRTYTHLLMGSVSSPYSCYRAALQLILHFLDALILKHLEICSLSWGTCSDISSTWLHLNPEPIIISMEKNTSNSR